MAEEEKKETKMRQIIIETDGKGIHVVKADVYSHIEFTAILQMVIAHITKEL